MTLKSVRDEEHERMQLAGVSAGAYHRGAETAHGDDMVTTRPHFTRQSDTKIVISLLILLVPQEGFEPPTPSLRMRCSTS